MKCILHIGTEKTGTTLLQTWLRKNKTALSAQGIALAEHVDQPNNRLLPAFFASQLDDWAISHGITSLEEKQAYLTPYIRAFEQDVARQSQDHDTCILTSEHFHSRVVTDDDLIALKDFLTPLFEEVKVLCYFRNQYDLALSLYSTGAKLASKQSLKAHLSSAKEKSLYYNYNDLAKKWADVFGKENCVFKIYDRGRFLEKDIRLDFIKSVKPDVDTDALDYSVESENESLSLIEALAYRVINKKLPYWHEDGSVNEANLTAKAQISSFETLKVGRIDPGCRAEIEGRFAPSNTAFFETYFGTENQFLTPDSDQVSGPPLEMHQVATLVEDLLDIFAAETKPAIHDKDSETLRDIALRIERSGALPLEDALALMRLAQRARPNGPVIVQKVMDWSEKLGDQA